MTRQRALDEIDEVKRTLAGIRDRLKRIKMDLRLPASEEQSNKLSELIQQLSVEDCIDAILDEIRKS